MKSLFKKEVACSALLMASMASHSTAHDWDSTQEAAQASLSVTVAGSDDDQADSADADTMLA